jgi:hypothetical protein
VPLPAASPHGSNSSNSTGSLLLQPVREGEENGGPAGVPGASRPSSVDGAARRAPSAGHHHADPSAPALLQVSLLLL